MGIPILQTQETQRGCYPDSLIIKVPMLGLYSLFQEILSQEIML